MNKRKKRFQDAVTHLEGNRWIKALHFKDCAHLWSQNQTGEERGQGWSRRTVVPIIDISGLGKHGQLKLSQKHTLLKSKDKPPLSRRCVHVCLCVHVRIKCVYAITLRRNKWAGDKRQARQPEKNAKLISVLQFSVLSF